jgi:PKD repeat protein
MKPCFSLLFCLLLPFIAFAQKEGNMWYFGNNAGLDFNSGTAVVITGSLTNLEGCAAISDKNGNILFYSNGETIWNKKHEVMLNGTGLSANLNSTQSCLIIPLPGSPYIYYIFTTDPITNGCRYSIVDIRLDSNLGAVTVKNSLLFLSSTEKLTAAMHQNNTDIWIITHLIDSDVFYSYLLTSSGIEEDPVISNTGSLHISSSGYMKTSPTQNKIALAISKIVEIFDFNNLTGNLSNPISIPTSDNCYGIEFSSDESKLYYSSRNSIYQVDIETSSELNIIDSKTLIYTSTGLLGGLQLGPDQKIYTIRLNNAYLGIIHNPNQKGTACNYVEDALYLNGNITKIGLPNFLPSYFKKEFISLNNCQEDTTNFYFTNNNSVSTVLWNFNDPNSSDNTSDLLNPSHVYKSTGTYEVSLTVTYENNISKSFHNDITIKPSPQFSLGNDTSVCPDYEISITLPNTGPSYEWQDGSTNAYYQITSADTFWVKATLGECQKTDSIIISFESIPSPNLGEDTTLCNGDTLHLEVIQNNADFLWNDFSDKSYFNVFSSGKYYVEASNKCGSAKDEINVNFTPCCDPAIPNLLTANNDGYNENLFITCIEDNGWKIEVVNRWGQTVYKSENYSNDLYGTQLQEGIYYYTLTKKSRQTHKGWFQIVK